MAYLRIAKDSKYSFLLESVIGGESVSRYSFIGAGQFLLMMPFCQTHKECPRSFQGDQVWTWRRDFW